MRAQRAIFLRSFNDIAGKQTFLGALGAENFEPLIVLRGGERPFCARNARTILNLYGIINAEEVFRGALLARSA